MIQQKTWVEVVAEVAENPRKFNISGIGRARNDGSQPRIFAPSPSAARESLKNNFSVPDVVWSEVVIEEVEFVALGSVRFDFFGLLAGIGIRLINVTRK